MERLEEIKADYNRGRMSFENMDWLIEQVTLLSAQNNKLNKGIREARLATGLLARRLSEAVSE